MENSFLTHMIVVQFLVRMKWHYFIIDLKCSGYPLQHETLRRRINIRIHYIFFCEVYIYFLLGSFILIVFIYFSITFGYIFNSFFCHIVMFVIELLNIYNKGSLYSFNYIIILAISFCLILNLWRFIYFRFSRLLLFLQLFYYLIQNCTWRHECVSGWRGLSEFCNYFVAFHVLLNVVLILLTSVSFRFSNSIIPLNLIINWNLGTIPCCAWFIIH
jgi:hypothetical protein